jgi:GTPase SAR1 family protein
MVDIANQLPLNNLKEIIVDFKNNIKNLPIILIGNKLDLTKERQISHQENLEYAKENNLPGYCEISSLK